MLRSRPTRAAAVAVLAREAALCLGDSDRAGAVLAETGRQAAAPATGRTGRP